MGKRGIKRGGGRWGERKKGTEVKAEDEQKLENSEKMGRATMAPWKETWMMHHEVDCS